MANQTTNSNPQSKVGLLADIARNIQLVWRLAKDGRVSTLTKLVIPGLAALYLLWPADLLPDVLPALGQLDDLALLALAVKVFIELCPKEIVHQHQADIAAGRTTDPTSAYKGDREGEVVDGEYRVME